MTVSTVLRRTLLPLTPLYRLGLVVREFRLRRGGEPVRRLRFPVISVGNLSTGGAGKTPFTIALSQALTRRGWAVDVLSRGYGRRNTGAARVRFDGHAEEFGDEPLLIAREAGVPVYVAGGRYEAGLLAEAFADQGSGTDRRPRVHILDDGFQHRQLHRDVDILLIDRHDWRDWLLPAGSLREARKAAGRATVLAIPDRDSAFESELRNWGWQGPIWRLSRRMEIPPVATPVVAFSGIARPRQFFAGLEVAGLQIAARMAFRDHHRYTGADIERLLSAARTAGAAALITTGKDEVRLGKLRAALAQEVNLLTAGLTIVIEDEHTVLDWLVGGLAVARSSVSL